LRLAKIIITGGKWTKIAQFLQIAAEDAPKGY
jgi:hypothetical protein